MTHSGQNAKEIKNKFMKLSILVALSVFAFLIFSFFLLTNKKNAYRIESKVIFLSHGLTVSSDYCEEFNKSKIKVNGYSVYIAPHSRGLLIISDEYNFKQKGFTDSVVSKLIE